jgi:lysophospholipase L1-like esterase
VLLGGNRAKLMYGVAAVGETTRVACVGDSITAGSGYVGELERLLGEAYDVRNFGVPSTTLLSRGERPYVKEQKSRDALDFKPHVVVVMLGTNDTKPQNYKHIGDFAADYKRLLAEFAALPTKPRVFLCTPVPVYYDGNWGIDNGRLNEGVLPGVRKVAEELKLPVIDMNQALSGRPDLFHRDNVHPVGGQTLMAAEVYRAITGREAPVAKQPPPPLLTRVACLGDSITEASGYPEALQRLLGNKYIVRNFGLSSATLLADGDRPYRKQGKYQALKDFNPQVVLFMLGTNDTKPENYKHIDRFEQDGRDLLDDLATLPAKPKVFLCKPVPVYGDGNWGIDNGRLTEGVIPHLEAVARDRHLPLVDMYAALSDKPELFKDNVHPIGGQLPMARAALAAIRQELPSPPSEENLLRNPGIESGLEPWIARGGTLAVVAEPVVAGRKALKLTGRKAHWHGPGQEVKEQLLKRGAGYYDVRAAVRLPEGGAMIDAVVVLMITDDAGTRYLKTTSRPVDAADWTEFDDQLFIAWTGTLRGALMYVETLGTLDDQLLLDECGLSRLPAPTSATK